MTFKEKLYLYLLETGKPKTTSEIQDAFPEVEATEYITAITDLLRDEIIVWVYQHHEVEMNDRRILLLALNQ